MKSSFLICSALLALVVSAAISHADDTPDTKKHFYSVFAPKPVAPPVSEDCPKGMNLSKFGQLVAQYPKVYNNKSAALEQWDLEDQVTNAVFCAVGAPEYLEYLKLINAVASTDKPAYYNLAKRLQAHWQTQYALAIAQIQAKRMNTISDDSMKLSLLVTALSLFTKNTAAVPTLFSVIRQFFPVLLPGAAVGSAELINKYGLFEGRYPLSPAHVMTFPLPSEASSYDWYDVEKNVGAAMLSVAGAEIATKIVGGVTEAITLGKVSFNPATILASFAVGYAVQAGSKVAIDQYQYHRLVKEYLTERDNVLRAMNNKDYMGMRTSADNFKKAAIFLSSFMDRPSLDVWVDFDSDVKSASGQVTWKKWLATDLMFYTGKTSEYLSPDEAYRKTKVLALAKDRDEKLETLQADEDPVSLQDVQMEIAMNIMAVTPDNTKLLSGEQEMQGKLISQGFSLYKQSLAPIVVSDEQAYKNYLTKLNQDRDTLLVQELQDGKVYKNPSHVLLQASAFIRSLNQPVLNSIGDDLLNIIFSGELFK